MAIVKDTPPIDLLLKALNVIECVDLEIVPRPEIDHEDVILIVHDTHLGATRDILIDRYASCVCPSRIEEVKLEIFVDALIEATELGSQLLINDESRLVLSSVKKLKGAGYIIESLGSIHDDGKSYVAVRTSKGLIVVYLEPSYNRAFTSAISWQAEINAHQVVVNAPSRLYAYLKALVS